MTDESEEPQTLAECMQCHQHVPENQIVRLYGKQLCFGCAASWFGGDEDDDKEE